MFTLRAWADGFEDSKELTALMSSTMTKMLLANISRRAIMLRIRIALRPIKKSEGTDQSSGRMGLMIAYMHEEETL
jgi:hypothetical protein